MKIICFYLPQFHEINENNKWWGKGFTEWTNVKKGTQLFPGHEQPKIPLNDNYYNLLDDDVKKWQIEIAKKSGIYGFCFYHYWFAGKLLLEKPIEQFLRNTDLDFPFCLCWANPAWTKVWAGKGSEVLIQPEYDNKDLWEKHFQYLLPFFKDSRYIKENNMPLFIIYQPEDIPNIKELVSFFRKRIIEEGFPGIKIAYQYYVEPNADERLRPIFDYCIEFQPVYALNKLENSFIIRYAKKLNNVLTKRFNIYLSDHMPKLRVSDYDNVWKTIINMKPLDRKSLPGAFVAWDNTPRRGINGRVIINSSPDKFEKYFCIQLERAKEIYHSDYIFITAWNEWSEGSYLEPDTRYGYAYLNAIRNALYKLRSK